MKNDRTNPAQPEETRPAEPRPAAPFAKAFQTRYIQNRHAAQEVIDVRSYSSDLGPGVEVDTPHGSWSFRTAEEIDAFAAILKQALPVDPFPVSTTPESSKRFRIDPPHARPHD